MLLRQKVILIILGIFLCIALLEIGLRLGGFVLLYLQKCDNIKTIQQKGAYRILCLGESTTALGRADSYPSQLEKILNRQNLRVKFSVVNEGVSGIGTSNILARLEGNLNKYKPDMVMAMMGINDGADYVFYKDADKSKGMLFFKSFRVYKLFKLLKINIANKSIEQRINRPIELKYFYKDWKDNKETEGELEKIIIANPENDSAWAELGWRYMNQESDNQAEEAFKKALEINSKNYSASEGLG